MYRVAYLSTKNKLIMEIIKISNVIYMNDLQQKFTVINLYTNLLLI